MPESEIPLDDRTRFANFLAIFSEKFVASLVRSLVYNGYYPAELNQMFDEYPKSVGAISSRFDHPRLEKARVEFNKAFMELTGFLNRDFEIPDYFLDENRAGRKFSHLLPKIHAKFSGHPQTPEEYAEWNKHKRMLDDAVEKFEITHRELLWAAKMTLK